MRPDLSRVVITTRARYSAAKNWIRWVGMAAWLQHSNELDGCDHTLKDKKQVKPLVKDQRVRTPKDAKTIRRMPWGRNSPLKPKKKIESTKTKI